MSDRNDPSSRGIIIIGLVVLGLLIAGGLVVWGVSHGFGPRKSEQQLQTYAQDATRIEIQSDSGNVEIRTGADNEVKVDRTLYWYTDKPVPSETFDGTTFRVKSTCIGNCHIDYKITVPADVSVRVDSDSGEVTIAGMSGDVEAEADSGDIDLSDLSGNLKLKVDSGTVDAERISSPTVDVNTSSGDVDVAFTAAPTRVTADMDSGNLTLKVPASPDGYAITVDLDSGTKDTDKVNNNPASTHSITATLDSGDVTVSNA